MLNIHGPLLIRSPIVVLPATRQRRLSRHNPSQRWYPIYRPKQVKAIGLHLDEADTWHCLGYLTGTDLVKLS